MTPILWVPIFLAAWIVLGLGWLYILGLRVEAREQAERKARLARHDPAETAGGRAGKGYR